MSPAAIERAFRELQNNQRWRLGVTWRVSHRTFGYEWAFHSFHRYKSFPKGNGAVALREICALADEHGIALSLWCSPSLYSYYQNFGFVIIPGIGLGIGERPATLKETA